MLRGMQERRKYLVASDSILSALLGLVDHGGRNCVVHSVWESFFFFPLQDVRSRILLSLDSLLCRACIPAGGGWACLSVRGFGWLQQISGIQLLGSSPDTAALS